MNERARRKTALLTVRMAREAWHAVQAFTPVGIPRCCNFFF